MCSGAVAFGIGKVGNVALTLDEVIRIPTHPWVTTTLVMPHTIEDIDAAFYTDDPGAIAGDWLFSFDKGSRIMSLIPMSYDSPPRNVNIASGGVVYALSPYVTIDPQDAYAVVHFKGHTTEPPTSDGAKGKESQNNLPVDTKPNMTREMAVITVSDNPPAVRQINRSAEVLEGFSQRIKLLSAVDEYALPAVLDKMPGIAIGVRDMDRIGYGDAYEVILLRVVSDRNNQLLGFNFLLRNMRDAPIEIVPGSLYVRLGENVYPLYAPDMPVEIGAGESEICFAMMANPLEMSVDNDFRIGAQIGEADSDQ